MPEARGTVQGKVPDSVEEWRVSQSLDKFGWTYEFQSPVMGGISLRGGQVIDFVVDTVPTQTALYIQGPYYHGTLQKEKDRLMQSIKHSG